MGPDLFRAIIAGCALSLVAAVWLIVSVVVAAGAADIPEDGPPPGA